MNPGTNTADLTMQALLEIVSRMTDPDKIRDLILAWYTPERQS